MKPLKARVRGGHLVLDEPTDLPEGAVLELLPTTDWDDLGEAERAALDSALEDAWAVYKSGKTEPAEKILQGLRSRR